MKIIAIGGTRLIGSKSVAILRLGITGVVPRASSHCRSSALS